MHKKNGGRRKRRHSSGHHPTQRKEAKIIFSPDSQNSFELYNSTEEDPASLKLTLVKDKENKHYSISQSATSTPIRTNRDYSMPSPLSSPEAGKSNTIITEPNSNKMEEGTNTVISDNDFKSLVINKLSMIESNILQLSTNLVQLNNVVSQHTLELDEVKTALNAHKIEITQIKKDQEGIGKTILLSQKIPKPESIIIKNLCKGDWLQAQISAECNKLLKSLDEKAPDIISATKMGSSNVIKVMLGPDHTIGDVLKVKRELRKSKIYEKVYIDKEKSVAEQKTEASLRAIAYVTPGLIFRRGQLQAGNRTDIGARGGGNPPGHPQPQTVGDIPANQANTLDAGIVPT